MLVNILIWIYIFASTYLLGRGFMELSGMKVSGESREFGAEDVSIAGLVIAISFSQIFSLFAGVSLVADIALTVLAIISFIYSNKKHRISFSEIIPCKNKIVPVSVFVAVLVMAYGASRGYFHYDSDLYHGQAIHWIEDYGVVKGLGNLHGRLAYNSSSFALTALYSFAYLGGRSYHACAGYLALLVLLSCLKIFHVIKDKKVLPGDFARIAAFYYICNIYDEMTSPASDYFSMLFFLYAIIKILDGIAEKRNADYYAFPALVAFCDVTVKFSSAPFCLIVFIPLIMLIREKNVKKILYYAVCVLFILMPFFIRNYIISGWLLYPSAFPDLFNPEWKIPEMYLVPDSKYIIAFGRGYSNMEAADLQFSEWFPHWYEGLERIWKLMLFLAGSGILVWFCNLYEGMIRKRYKESGFIILNFTVFSAIVSFFFWLFSSPLIRYGQAYVIAIPCLTFGTAFCTLLKIFDVKIPGRFLRTMYMAVMILFFVYKGLMTARYMIDVKGYPYYIQPLDYGVYETEEVRLGNVSVYAPVSGDRTGYYDFPSVPVNSGLPLMYDPDDLSKGFIEK